MADPSGEGLFRVYLNETLTKFEICPTSNFPAEEIVTNTELDTFTLESTAIYYIGTCAFPDGKTVHTTTLNAENSNCASIALGSTTVNSMDSFSDIVLYPSSPNVVFSINVTIGTRLGFIINDGNSLNIIRMYRSIKQPLPGTFPACDWECV